MDDDSRYDRTPTLEELYTQPNLDELRAMPRNQLVIDKEMYQPAATKKFESISRDMTLSKINAEDTINIRLLTYEGQVIDVIIQALKETGHTEDELDMLKNVKENFESDLATLVNAKRAEGGFTFEGLTKQRYQVEQRYKSPTPQKTGLRRFLPGA